MTSAVPIVVLERVRAVDTAGAGQRPRGRLFGASAAFGAGVHAILGAPEDGTLALVDALSGRSAPASGRVLVAGEAPSSHPGIRARIGVLAAVPELPGGASVASSMASALRARGEPPGRAAVLLASLGLGPLASRRVASLSFAESRAVELVLALSTPTAALVVLVEPFAEIALAPVENVRRRIRELGAEGTCVVLVTSAPSDARTLADRIHVLDRGVIVREESGDGERLAIGPTQGSGVHGGVAPDGELLVLVREPGETLGASSGSHDVAGAGGVRVLAAAVACCPAVRGVAWEQRPTESVATLRIRASDKAAAALAVLDAAAADDVSIVAISSPAPSMREVRAATTQRLSVMRRFRPFGAPLGVAPGGVGGPASPPVDAPREPPSTSAPGAIPGSRGDPLPGDAPHASPSLPEPSPAVADGGNLDHG